MKLRSDSTLASLTEDQRDQLYDWLCSASYAEVIALAFVAYEKIHRRRDIDEHAKIWKARDVAFGKPPTGQSAKSTDNNSVLASPARTPQSSELPSPSAPSAVIHSDNSVLSPQSFPLKNSTHSDTLLHANSSAPAPLPPAQRVEVPTSPDSDSHLLSQSERHEQGNKRVAGLGSPSADNNSACPASPAVNESGSWPTHTNTDKHDLDQKPQVPTSGIGEPPSLDVKPLDSSSSAA